MGRKVPNHNKEIVAVFGAAIMGLSNNHSVWFNVHKEVFLTFPPKLLHENNEVIGITGCNMHILFAIMSLNGHYF